MKFNSKPLEKQDREYIEPRESLESRKLIFHLLDRYDSQPQYDPIIAVPTWKDIAHPEVARRLYERSYSVCIADLAENFDEQESQDDFIFGGPVMDHISENKARLKAYLDSLGLVETLGENQVNSDRKKLADIFAEKTWVHIERIARELNTTIQSEIAARLNKEGYRTAQGAEISQSHIHRFIGRAGKKDEWEAIKKAIEKPDLFDAANQK